MPRRQPGYLHYKEKNLARVIIDGKPIYLGRYNSPESWEKYHRILAELAVAKSVPESADADEQPLTVNELFDAFWQYGPEYYGDHAESTIYNYRPTLDAVRDLYGTLPAAEFSPKKLLALQQHLIQKDQTRTYVNMQTSRIKRVWRWAVSRELLPASVYQAVSTVPGIAKGRMNAKEGRRVRPVADDVVNATLEHLPPTLAAMVQVQRLTGARSGEVCKMRPCDIDRSGDVWIYRPAKHKTERHEIERAVPIGPRAQKVLRPFLLRDSVAPCFSPIESEQQRHPDRRVRRTVSPTYTNDSYRRAIERACRANDIPVWTPNRLRHTRATELRQQAGYEVARTTLGHKTDITEIYAERDLETAAEAARKFG